MSAPLRADAAELGAHRGLAGRDEVDAGERARLCAQRDRHGLPGSDVRGRDGERRRLGTTAPGGLGGSGEQQHEDEHDEDHTPTFGARVCDVNPCRRSSSDADGSSGWARSEWDGGICRTCSTPWTTRSRPIWSSPRPRAGPLRSTPRRSPTWPPRSTNSTAGRARNCWAWPRSRAITSSRICSTRSAIRTSSSSPIPTGTSDLRGIDTSVAYDDRKLRVLEQRSHVIHLLYATRDIFEVVFEVIETGETLVVLATHWPSRSTGRWRSEPLRIALAENVAYIVRDHVRFNAQEYLALKAAGDLAAVQARWETKVLIMGDLNDEPSDRSLVENLPRLQRDRPRGRADQRDQGASPTRSAITAPTTPSCSTPAGSSWPARTPAPTSSTPPATRRSPTATRCSIR